MFVFVFVLGSIWKPFHRGLYNSGGKPRALQTLRDFPALLHLGHGTEARFLAALRGGTRTVSLLSPDLLTHRVPCEAVRDALCGDLERPHVAAWALATQASSLFSLSCWRTRAR